MNDKKVGKKILIFPLSFLSSFHRKATKRNGDDLVSKVYEEGKKNK